MTIDFNDLEKLRDRLLRETMRQRTPVRPPDRKTDKTGEMESCTRDQKENGQILQIGKTNEQTD